MNKFQPKEWKHSKVFKRKKFFEKRKELKHFTLKNGRIGLKLLECAQLNSLLLENLRKTLAKDIKKLGKFWFYCHANIPLTKKSVGVRMGKGSGNISEWVCRCKKGKIITEISKEVSLELATVTLTKLSKKLPVRSKIIKSI